jgi:hypothetical protein
MSDNTNQQANDTISTDELAGGVKVQRVKVQHGTDGSATDVSASSPLPVGVQSALPAGSNSIGQVDPRGNVAHDAPDSGNPVKVGGKARTALVAVSGGNDRTDLSTDKFGRVFVLAAPMDQWVSGQVSRTDGVAVSVIAAPGASTAVVVTDVLVTNAHATVGTKVSIRDGEVVKLTGFAGANGGGFQLSNPDGIFLASTNTAISAICATSGSNIEIFVAGYKVPA